MAKYPCEMVAHFYYNPNLTYEELHQKEEELLQQVDSFLTAEGAYYLNFSAGSDSIAVQCEFDQFDQALFSYLAECIKDLLPSETESRLLFVDKDDLMKIYIYSISPEKVEEKEIVMNKLFVEKE